MVEDPAPAFRVAPLPRGGHSSYLHLGHDVAAMLLDKYCDRPYCDGHLPAVTPYGMFAFVAVLATLISPSVP